MLISAMAKSSLYSLICTLVLAGEVIPVDLLLTLLQSAASDSCKSIKTGRSRKETEKLLSFGEGNTLFKSIKGGLEVTLVEYEGHDSLGRHIDVMVWYQNGVASKLSSRRESLLHLFQRSRLNSARKGALLPSEIFP